ncbi:DNA-directed RNA polymerase subunit omega [Geofilum sp. OHC36d9]|uniref:DNA-directed RNA polymerase subunit omega n=1 Tax=Geofilum sp. OHC36d9 TaxID=3458413 RepID=UPI004033B94D
MDYKKSKAPSNTITWDTKVISEATGNLYESVMIMAKRSNQISVEMKEELNRKLQEFASYTDNLEEVFENREQIEISKFYERLPKANALAVTEFLDGKTYFRNPEKEENPENLLKEL